MPSAIYLQLLDPVFVLRDQAVVGEHLTVALADVHASVHQSADEILEDGFLFLGQIFFFDLQILLKEQAEEALEPVKQAIRLPLFEEGVLELFDPLFDEVENVIQKCDLH